MEKDLFGNPIIKPDLELNLYADEAMDRKCPYTNTNWHYMCLIFENANSKLLNDIISERFCNNFDENSQYYKKNNKILHWTDLRSADEKNICKRWFEYILESNKSAKTFYCYILGLNESFLNDDEFDKKNKFNSIYNRFFRTAIDYGVKCFFPEKDYSKITIKNIYHEQGQQEHSKYFSWHSIDKLKEKTHISFETDRIEFLSKDHNTRKESNIIQLCDCFLGAVVNIIHGIENPTSSSSKIKKELLDLLLPLIKRIIENPNNKNSSYAYFNRIMIRFFPKMPSQPRDTTRSQNQWYTQRKLKYEEDIFGLLSFNF